MGLYNFWTIMLDLFWIDGEGNCWVQVPLERVACHLGLCFLFGKLQLEPLTSPDQEPCRALSASTRNQITSRDACPRSTLLHSPCCRCCQPCWAELAHSPALQGLVPLAALPRSQGTELLPQPQVCVFCRLSASRAWVSGSRRWFLRCARLAGPR